MTGDVSIFQRALYKKDGAAKIMKDLRRHGMLPDSIVFLSPSQARGFSGIQGAVCSVANQMELKTGERPKLVVATSELGRRGNQVAVNRMAKRMELKTGERPTLAAAASELGSRGNQVAVCRMAKRMELKTGEMPTLEAAASERGSRGLQGAVRSITMQMELKTGEMPSLEAAASELGRTSGWKSVGKPKRIAVWAKVVQTSGSDEEIQGTEKCADTTTICAELCHQGIGLTYSSCRQTKYIGMWFKYAGESADNLTVIFHEKVGKKNGS